MDLTTQGLQALPVAGLSLAGGGGGAAGSAALVVAAAFGLAGSQSTGAASPFLAAFALVVSFVLFFLAAGSGGHSGLVATGAGAGAAVD